MKLTDTQINALKLANEIPSCLIVGYHGPTESKLHKLGLIEPSGPRASGTHGWIITDAGKREIARAALDGEKG